MTANAGRIGKLGSATKGRVPLPLEKFYPHIVLALIGFFVADLSILYFRDVMIPTQAPPSRPARIQDAFGIAKSSYNSISSRNIFNSDGVIPDPIANKNKPDPGQEPEAIPSQLPLGLIGTIVHSNPEKSIANIEIKGKNQIIAFTPKRDIDNMATLVRVERNRAILRNNNNGRLEFIENKPNSKISFSASKILDAPAGAPTGNQIIKETAPNKYELLRSDLNKYLTDVSSILMQASSLPRKKPNGDIECFVITSIQPNSIYTQLGIMNGDCIKGVNGEPVDSPAKALEMFNALKNSNSIKLTVERDGQDNDKEYTVK